MFSQNKKVELEQNSREWLEFRRARIGASDVPIILGISPYKSPYELYMEKKGKVEPKFSHNMEYGRSLEDEIRKKLMDLNGKEYQPMVYQHPQILWLMASVDGIDFAEKEIVEIKVCNRHVFEQAQEGIIVPHYYAQIQAQLQCVPSAEKAIYVCYFKGDMVSVEVGRNDEWFKENFPTLKEFYMSLMEEVPPEATQADYIVIDDDPELESEVQELKEISKLLKELSLKEKDLKARIVDRLDDGNAIAYGMKISRRGRVTTNYRQACIDASIDLEKYKSESVGYWEFKAV